MDRRLIVEKIVNLKNPGMGKLSGTKLFSNLYVSVNNDRDLGIFLDNVDGNPEGSQFGKY